MTDPNATTMAPDGLNDVTRELPNNQRDNGNPDDDDTNFDDLLQSNENASEADHEEIYRVIQETKEDILGIFRNMAHASTEHGKTAASVSKLFDPGFKI
jgi:hypothetical protein